MSPNNLEKGQSQSIQTSQLQNLLQFYTNQICLLLVDTKIKSIKQKNTR